ncbi:hypothetical protein LTR16_000414 [Cryomyces antarcticus]|uniref:Uncharacterized protein n=1 Tax=Cryomyces antarcticus TaxID=329879 RepID=A0ABR0KVQ1_9PEZI|nr:hypothetical protein LTR39_000294 [Cryomyces antarcticus]KAK5021104.1 hypothetical protein LTR60_000122 [Cryomyces antarcticus]KAK5131781.1 hypothetical protein LTR16_000414 [Cryomyces antarcticus]
MRVMGIVNATQYWNLVDGDVYEEEERVVEEKGHEELEDKTTTRGRSLWKGTVQLQRRIPREVVQRGREERGFDAPAAAKIGIVVAALTNGRHGDARVFLDEYEIEKQEGGNRFADFEQAFGGAAKAGEFGCGRGLVVIYLWPDVDAEGGIVGEAGVKGEDFYGLDEGEAVEW